MNTDLKSEVLATTNMATEIAITVTWPWQADLEISRLQQARKKSQPQRCESLPLQHCMDRAKQAYSNGQNELLQIALGDLILICVDIANSWGIDLQDVVTRKMERNFVKYNPAITREFMAKGMSALEGL
jgi:hypothetical protein